jgi:putative effector of murein hydrolase LrgA (UPF0299 family)
MASRSTVGWALLFAVPPGVGVTGYTAMLSGEGFLGPVSVAAGLVTAGAIFAVVFGSQQVGSPDPDRARNGTD